MLQTFYTIFCGFIVNVIFCEYGRPLGFTKRGARYIHILIHFLNIIFFLGAGTLNARIT